MFHVKHIANRQGRASSCGMAVSRSSQSTLREMTMLGMGQIVNKKFE
jgi:hypothetical protein